MRDLPWMAGHIPASRLLVGRDGGNGWLGFWPYQVVAKRARGIVPVRICTPWGGDSDRDPGVSTRMRFWALCAPDPPPGFAPAFVSCFLERTRWNLLETGCLPKDHPLSLAWEESLAANRLAFRKRVGEDAVIGSWSSFDAYLMSLNKRWRKSYRRLMKEQVASGRVRVELLGDFPGDALDRAVGRILEIYRGSWKASSGAEFLNLSRADTLAAFAARLAAFAKGGALQILFVAVDGEDAAFEVCVRHGDMYCDLQAAFLEKYASLGVGFLAAMETNRYLIGQGMREVNQFEYQDYKGHQGAKGIPSVSYDVYSRDAVGRLLLLVHSARRRLRAGDGGIRYATRRAETGDAGDGDEGEARNA